MIVPSTEVPITPPSWKPVCWMPPATPALSTGALPTIAWVEATMISPSAIPTATNHGHCPL